MLLSNTYIHSSVHTGLQSQSPSYWGDFSVVFNQEPTYCVDKCAFVFTCKLLCYIWAFWLIVFWPVANVLSLPFKKDRDGKERLVSLSIGKVKLVTYFSHYLLNKAIKKLVTTSRCLELGSPPNLACLVLHRCLCNMLNNFMLVPDWCVSATLKRMNRKNLAEFI